MITVWVRSACGVVLTAALMVSPSQMAAGQTDFATVKTEVAAGQARHMAQAEYVQFDRVGEQYDELNKHALVSRVRSRLRRTGQWYLAEESVDVTPPPDLKGLMPRRKSGVVALNSRYGFELGRPGGPTEWRLKDVHLTDSTDPSPPNLKAEFLARGTLFAQPYEISSTLTDLFNAPSFRLLGCAPSPRNPALVRVKFENNPPPVGKRHPTQLIGWCDLDPGAGWSIRGFEVTSDDRVLRDTTSTDVTSSIDKDGLVRIDEERQEVRIVKGETLLAHRTQFTTYKIWVDRDVPEREFSLTAYGLPEPPGISFVRPTPMYVWLLIGAGGFAILALVFRWLTHRKPAPSTL